MGGMDAFAPFQFPSKNASFIVRNVTPDHQKTIKIFAYPILYNCTRDLLQIKGVSEGDIRASLLKGELRHKILVKDIIVEYSDIDLLQFNAVFITKLILGLISFTFPLLPFITVSFMTIYYIAIYYHLLRTT